MPKTNSLTLEGKVLDRIEKNAGDLEVKLFKAHISKQAVADAAGITRQAVCIQFRKKRLMPEVTAAAEILLEMVN